MNNSKDKIMNEDIKNHIEKMLGMKTPSWDVSTMDNKAVEDIIVNALLNKFKEEFSGDPKLPEGCTILHRTIDKHNMRLLIECRAYIKNRLSQLKK